MNESTSISVEQSSTNSLTLSKKELIEKASSLPEETIVYASDEMNRPYIILKDIDGNKYPRAYGGESMEDIRKFHKWELEAMQNLKDKARSADEVTHFRNVLMSVGNIADLLDFTPDEISGFIESVVYKVSIRWYCKDKNINYKEFVPKNQADNELIVYYQMAMFYAMSFCNTFMSVKENMEGTNETQQREDSEPKPTQV